MARRAETPTEAELRLARQSARVDQALAIAAAAMRAHSGDRHLVDVLLDITNALRVSPRPRP